MPLPTYRQPVANQLTEYYKKYQDDEDESATTTSGNPIAYKDASETAGPKGLILLQDSALLDELAHFDRERIPERVVHAKGSGAFGYFEVTHDITTYSAACVFASIGKRTPIAVRFSQVIGESGYADTVRDPRGFAVKFYTEDGIWDLVGNNTPIFFIRDPVLFPNFIHSFKRNPVTNIRDADAFWDFISLRPESTHQIMILFSDRGIPDGYRYMNGYGSNTFSFVNAVGQFYYCKFHYLSEQGIKNIMPDRAMQIAGADPEYSTRDLYNSIASGNFPTWKLYIQVMTPEESVVSRFNPFDVTKVWPHEEYPLIPVGNLVLNRNPTNYFAEVEQIALSPANMIPGIGPSPDRLLQGRLFSYNDTHRYRLGTNYLQLPVNCPFKVRNFSRDGEQTIDNQGGRPNYHPNSFGGPEPDLRAKGLAPSFIINGHSGRYDTRDDDNFTQPRVLYRKVLDEGGRTRLINNIVMHMKNAAEFIQERAVRNFAEVDADFGRRLTAGLQAVAQKQASL